VTDGKKWKDIVRQAKAHSGLYCQWKKKRKKFEFIGITALHFLCGQNYQEYEDFFSLV
jgi:hypothetical protein